MRAIKLLQKTFDSVYVQEKNTPGFIIAGEQVVFFTLVMTKIQETWWNRNYTSDL